MDTRSFFAGVFWMFVVMLLLAGVLALYRWPYPVRKEGERQDRFVVWLAVLVAINVPVLNDEAFTWQMRVFIWVPACAFVLTAARYALAVSTWHHGRGREISVWRALFVIKYYQRRGRAIAEVYRMRRYDSYYLHIEHPDRGSMVHVRIKRRDVARLLRALAVRHPHPPLEDGEWVIGMRISTWRDGQPSKVTYRVAHSPPYMGSLYDLRQVAIRRLKERRKLKAQGTK